jgi:hypothetical protein
VSHRHVGLLVVYDSSMTTPAGVWSGRRLSV